ncbi:MAG: fused MFS/spermidine synthase [Candidatus Limnocylindrales bacterium]
MVRIVVRGAASAIALYAALLLTPQLTWSPGTSVPGRVAILIAVGVVNGFLPVLLRRVGRPRRAWALAVSTLAVNGLLLVGLAVVRRFLHEGVALQGLARQPIESTIALALGAILLSAPYLVELLGESNGIALREVRPHPSRRSAVLLIFLLSGASGLIYEVVWSRQLVLVFGNTTQAISAILTGYFGGLAIGSVIGGRVADRVRRPLIMYATLELVLVVVVLITPALFRGIDDIYRSSYPALQGQPTTLALIRYLLAVAALAPATILMGATLPTLSRHLTRSTAGLGGNFGRLYAANTIGAVVGTIAAGLVLIELVGMSGTLLIGATGSAIAGIAALVLARLGPAASDASSATAFDGPAAEQVGSGSAGPVAVDVTSVPSAVRRLALLVAFVSGATSLGYQVLWTRLLASGSGNRTYVFTLILATFLVGLAIGAVTVSRLAGKSPSTIRRLGLTQVAVAGLALIATPILAADVASGWPLFTRILIVVLPTTIVMGFTLPLASNLIGLGNERIGRDAGLLLGANTIGAISATFLIPFAAIPLIGSPRSLVVLCAMNAAVGTLMLARATDIGVPVRRAAALAGAILTGVAIVGLVVPNIAVADPGLTRMAKAGIVYASTEDEIASVQAGEIRGAKGLWVGGNGMTALTVDAKLMPLMPEFVRPSATRMLVIAFGMGSSYEMGLRSGLSVDGVELVPSVPEMFGYFNPNAEATLANPQGHVIIADGRNYLELTDKQYDIVMVDPPPPIESSGTAVLYSQEFYQAAARRLSDDGVMMEWMPGGQSVDEFRAHVRTFESVFPNVLLVFGAATHGVYITGSRGPATLDAASIASVLTRAGVVDDLDQAADAPVSSLADWEALIPKQLWLSGPAVAGFAGTGPLITDDRPLTEYFLLRHTFGPPSPPSTEENLRAAAP